MSDQDLNEPELSSIAEAVRKRCASFPDDYWSDCDEQHRFPHEFYAAMAADGWVGMTFPEAYGGGGLGLRQATVVMHEIAASGAAMNGCTPLHLTIFALEPIVRFGNERLKSSFLPRAAAGDLHVAFGVTEPDAGSDTSRVRTAAVRTGDGWLISGQKIWTSKALEAELVLILARTAPASPEDRFGGLTLFLADLDPEHVAIRPIPKLGRNAVASCETFYDELPVEDWRLVGEEGKGFRHLLVAFNAERLLLAAEAIGVGHVALNRAVQYARSRSVFGRPIGANQAISHPLAVAYARLTAAWNLVQVAARHYDSGKPDGTEINTAKFLAAEAGFYAADRALQTLGGQGYARENHVERYWREARLMQLAPISQEMTLNFIAEHGLRLPRSR